MEITSIIWILVFSLFGGFFTKVIYWLLELQNPKLEAQDLLSYQSASQFLYEAPSLMSSIKYLSFRLFPNAVSTIFMIGLTSNSGLLSRQDLKWAVLIATLWANHGTVLGIFDRQSRSNVRLLQFVVTALVLATNATILYVHLRTDFINAIFPTTVSLIDNVWASLITAMLVAIYFRALPMSKTTSTSTQEASYWVEDALETQSANGEFHGKHSIHRPISRLVNRAKVRSARKTIRSLKSSIDATSALYSLPPQLTEAIIYVETLNRPATIRWIENLLVRIPGLQLTVGPAQIRSDRPLSNNESVEILTAEMAKVRDDCRALGLSGREILEEILYHHNSSYTFVDSVLEIFWELSFRK